MKKTAVIIFLGALALILFGLLASRSIPDAQKLSQSEFISMLQSNRLARVRIYYPPKPGQLDGVPVMLQEVRGTFYQTNAEGQMREAQGRATESPFIARVHLTEELENKLMAITNVSTVETFSLPQRMSMWFHRSKK